MSDETREAMLSLTNATERSFMRLIEVVSRLTDEVTEQKQRIENLERKLQQRV